MPAAWASQATFSSPVKNWVTKNKSSTTAAGTYTTWNAVVKMAVSTWARGNSTRYVPMATAMAPDAAMSGVAVWGLRATNPKVATIPPSR